MSEMNENDRKRFDIMQSDISEIKTAFLGNAMSGDKGFKGQIEVLNVDLLNLKKEVETLKEQRVENRVYILIIKGLFWLLVGSVVSYVFAKFN